MTTDLNGIKTTESSTVYCNVLEESLLPFGAEALGENWRFQLDNAPVHTSYQTENGLSTHNVVTIDWPARSPDLKT